MPLKTAHLVVLGVQPVMRHQSLELIQIQNNGIIAVLNGTGIAITNTRAPSLRDLGNPNGPMIHSGNLMTF